MTDQTQKSTYDQLEKDFTQMREHRDQLLNELQVVASSSLSKDKEITEIRERCDLLKDRNHVLKVRNEELRHEKNKYKAIVDALAEQLVQKEQRRIS